MCTIENWSKNVQKQVRNTHNKRKLRWRKHDWEMVATEKLIGITEMRREKQKAGHQEHEVRREHIWWAEQTNDSCKDYEGTHKDTGLKVHVRYIYKPVHMVYKAKNKINQLKRMWIFVNMNALLTGMLLF